MVRRLRLMRHEVDRRRHRRIVEIERGRREIVADRQRREDRLDRAGRAEQMADRRFGRGHRHLAGGVAEQPLDRGKLDLVAHRRRGAMRVDIVDIGGIDAGALHRRHHAAIGAVAVLGRRGDVERVARKPVADDLGIDAGAARLGVFEFLQHHHAGPLAHDEAVAVAVIGPRGALGLIVEIGRERAAGGEARDRQAADGRLRTAREHHVGIAERDQSATHRRWHARRSSRP